MKYKWTGMILILCILVMSTQTVLAQEHPLLNESLAPANYIKSNYQSLKSDAQKANTPSLHASEPSSVIPPMLENGDFEQGWGVGWSEYSLNSWQLVGNYPNVPVVRQGSWGAWLGADYNEYSALYQTVNIVNPTHLTLWYWVDSGEACGYDYGYVQVGLNHDTLYTWNLCSAYDTNSWNLLDLDLSSYGGQMATITIIVEDSPSTSSGLFIDDVALYETFQDVPYNHWAQDYIQRLYDAGITGGCGNGSYCPSSPVTRAQMAVFLEKGLHGNAFTPSNVSPTFNDTSGHWAEDWIEALKSDAITSGCGNNNYCPEDSVTRAQMAVFLLKAMHGSNYSPPAASPTFGDDAGHWAQNWIEELALEGITSGCGNGNYCPDSPVTRDQMAVFLVRAFGLP